MGRGGVRVFETEYVAREQQNQDSNLYEQRVVLLNACYFSKI